MKTCTSCHLSKVESEFSIRRASKDGLVYQCKKCKRACDNNRLPSIREHKKKYRVNHYRANKDRLNKEARNFRKENPLKVRARDAVRYALRMGWLVKEPCHCGETEVQGHHEDYSKPLDVEWLCAKCHSKKEQGE